MKFDLRFLAGFEREPFQFLNDFLRENIVQKLFVSHLVRVFDL
jgi:hypothetical protein